MKNKFSNGYVCKSRLNFTDTQILDSQMNCYQLFLDGFWPRFISNNCMKIPLNVLPKKIKLLCTYTHIKNHLYFCTNCFASETFLKYAST